MIVIFVVNLTIDGNCSKFQEEMYLKRVSELDQITDLRNQQREAARGFAKAASGRVHVRVQSDNKQVEGDVPNDNPRRGRGT